MKELITFVLLAALYGFVLGLSKHVGKSSEAKEGVKIAGWWAAWGLLGGIAFSGFPSNSHIWEATVAAIVFLLAFHFASYAKRCFFMAFRIPIE